MKKLIVFLIIYSITPMLLAYNYAIFIPYNPGLNVYEEVLVSVDDSLKDWVFRSKKILFNTPNALKYFRVVMSFLNPFDFTEINIGQLFISKNKNIYFFKHFDDNYYFYQEKGGWEFGRRKLLKREEFFFKSSCPAAIKSYENVFVFENEKRFESFRAFSCLSDSISGLAQQEKIVYLSLD